MASFSERRKITQATFDECVAENVEEFDMEPAEALADAVEQFERQGVDLSGVDTSGSDERRAEREALTAHVALLARNAREGGATRGALEDALTFVERACGKTASAAKASAAARATLVAAGGLPAIARLAAACVTDDAAIADEAVLAVIKWAKAARTRARSLRAVHPRSADEHELLFVRLQLAAAACIEHLLRQRSDEAQVEKLRDLFSRRNGAEALKIALEINAKELFASRVIQRYIEVVWRSGFTGNSMGSIFSAKGLRFRVVIVVVLLLQLTLLPFVALWPNLQDRWFGLQGLGHNIT